LTMNDNSLQTSLHPSQAIESSKFSSLSALPFPGSMFGEKYIPFGNFDMTP
jgi:hypothetical protein